MRVRVDQSRQQRRSAEIDDGHVLRCVRPDFFPRTDLFDALTVGQNASVQDVLSVSHVQDAARFDQFGGCCWWILQSELRDRSAGDQASEYGDL